MKKHFFWMWFSTILSTFLILFCLDVTNCQSDKSEYSDSKLNYDDTAPETEAASTFASNFRAQRAVLEEIGTDLMLTHYTQDSPSNFRVLESEIDRSLNFSTTKTAKRMACQIDNTLPMFGTRVTDLPTIFITNEDGRVPTSAYHPAVFSMTVPSGMAFPEVDECEITIKIHGNSTASCEKKPYNIRFGKKTALCGMDKGKKWVLLANAFDKTMLRNKLALDFARQLRLDYVPKCEYVDLYMDNSYRGVYLLCEAVTDGKNRVDIDTDKGDVLLELEFNRIETETIYIITGAGVRFKLNKPENMTFEETKSKRKT